jgi:hypothetical protein
MSPSRPSNNLTDSSAGNMESNSQFTLFKTRFSKPSNLNHIRGGKGCERMSLPSCYAGKVCSRSASLTSRRNHFHNPTEGITSRISSLRNHVGDVGFIVAKEQMARVDAFPVIAPMKYPYSMRNRANRNQIGHPMRPMRSPVLCILPVSFSVFGGGPNPASRFNDQRSISVYLGPESSLVLFCEFRERSCSFRHGYRVLDVRARCPLERSTRSPLLQAVLILPMAISHPTPYCQ